MRVLDAPLATRRQPDASGRLLTLRFNPSSPGSYAGAVEIESDSLGGQTLSFPIRGTSISKAARLRKSIESGRGLVLHYQPRISLATGRIVGAIPFHLDPDPSPLIGADVAAPPPPDAAAGGGG